MIAQLHRLGVQQLQPSIEAILSHGYRDRLCDSTIREQGICLSPGRNGLQEAAAGRAGPETTVWPARGEPNYIGNPPALPGDSKSLTAPYYETLRNADKSAATDLFGEGRRAKADEALPMEFSAAALWQTPGMSYPSSPCRTALATVSPQKTVQRGALAPAGIGSASSAFARVGQRSRPA